MDGAHSVKKEKDISKTVKTAMLILAVAAVIIFFLTTGRKTAIDSTAPANSTVGSAIASQNVPSSANDAVASAYSLQIRENYKNERFGFTVEVPVAFMLGSEIDDGSGVMLVSSSLRMTAKVVGYDNTEHLDADALADKLWNKREDSIIRSESDHVVIYQYDDKYEYFIWAYVGTDAIDQMTIRYPLQDENAENLKAAQVLMQGFHPGPLGASD